MGLSLTLLSVTESERALARRTTILSASDGDTDKVRAPIGSGADVSVFVGDGLTPLTEAAKHGHSDVATCLLETGKPVRNCPSPAFN